LLYNKEKDEVNQDTKLVTSIDNPPQEGEYLGSAFNLASAAIGLGIMSLPLTVKDAGLGLGVFLFVIMGLINIYSLDVVVSCAAICEKITFQDTVKEAFGAGPSQIFGGVLIWQATASTVASFIIVADLVTPSFSDSNMLADRNVVIVVSLVVLLPLCMLRKVNSLRIASAGAIASFLYMACFVFVKYWAGTKTDQKLVIVEDEWHLITSIPVIIYAYTCHSQAIPVYAELKHRTPWMMYRVIWGGVFLSFALYISVGIFGYLSFGGDVKSNILLNYDDGDPFVLIGRFAICSAIILGYPMSSWVMRNSFEQILFYFKQRSRSYMELEDQENETALFMQNWRYVSGTQNFLETAVILVGSMFLAILIPDITTIFRFAGSTSAVAINFIIPGFMYIQLCNKYARKDGHLFVHGRLVKHLKARKVCAGLLIFFGFSIGIIGTVTTIMCYKGC